MKTVDSKLDDGELSQKIRTLPALRAQVTTRLEQRLGLSEAGVGGLSELIARSVRRAQLAWSKYERDWQLPGGPIVRIPAGCVVTETKARISVRWQTSFVEQQRTGRANAGHLVIRSGVLHRQRWFGGEVPVPLHSVRTEELHPREGPELLNVMGTQPTGVVEKLFDVAAIETGEFLCEVICHFTGARRDTHSVRAFDL